MIISCPNCESRFNLNADLLGDTGRNVKCAKCEHRWFEMPAAESTAAAAPPPPAASPPPAAPPPPPPVAAPRAETPTLKDKGEDKLEEEEEEEEEEAEAEEEEEEEEEAQTAAMPSPPPIPSEADIARFQARPPPTKSTALSWVVLFLVVAGLMTGTVYFRRDVAAFYPPSNRLFLAIGLPTDTLGYGLKIHNPKTMQRAEGDNRILVIKGMIENETGNVIDAPLLRGAVKNTRGKELFVWSFKTKEPRILAGEQNTYETEVRNPPPGATQLSITFTRESEMMAEKKQAKAMAAKAAPKKQRP